MIVKNPSLKAAFLHEYTQNPYKPINEEKPLMVTQENMEKETAQESDEDTAEKASS